MARQAASRLADAELFTRIIRLAQTLNETIARQGWGGLTVPANVAALRAAVHEVETRLLRHQQEAREQLCQRRFGRLSDDELAERIAQMEHHLMSAMEVSGHPELVDAEAEQWRCACLVASKRPALWEKLLARGHCKGALPEFP